MPEPNTTHLKRGQIDLQKSERGLIVSWLYGYRTPDMKHERYLHVRRAKAGWKHPIARNA